MLQDIISQPATLIAFIALAGLLLQKRPVVDVIKGTLKSFLGFVLIGIGGGVVVGSLSYLGTMFELAFGVSGVLPNNEAIIALAVLEYGETAVWILFFGMIANLLFARFTKLKYVFLSTHLVFYMACLIGIVFTGLGMGGAQTIIVGAIALGLTMVVFPALAQPVMSQVTGSEEVALGHYGIIGHASAGFIGKLVRGKNPKSTEDISIPKSLSFFQDNSVSVAITMCILFLILTLAAGPGFVQNDLSGGTHFIVFAVMQGILFAAGVFIIVQGVQMMISEILPAFRGISEKVIPGAKPAFDCPIVFPHAPNAVLIGFLSSFAAGILGMLVLAAFGNVVIMPGVVAHFFSGGTGAVFGNATGGLRGAIIGAFFVGLLMTFAPLLLLPFLGDLGYASATFSDLDFIFVGAMLGNAGRAGADFVSALVAAAAGMLLIFWRNKNVI